METKNPLENENILPHEIRVVIKKLINIDENIVFGGSIALNAIGLIERRINDIDIFLPIEYSLSKNKFLTTIDEFTLSDTVTDMNGIEIQRTGAKIGNVKICVFKVEDEYLRHSLFPFLGGGIKIQNVNNAIMAKKFYQEKTNNKKHTSDLNSIIHSLENF